MRVFVAGASGAIGRPLVPKLIAAGHEVTGMTRSEEKAEARARGRGRAAVVDVFDADALRAAMVEAAPEVVVHQLTALPERMDFRKGEHLRRHEPPPHRGHPEPARRGERGRRAPVRLRRASPLPTGTRAIAVKTEDDPLLDNAPGPFGAA